jgi:spectinomycin phosphotransferase
MLPDQVSNRWWQGEDVRREDPGLDVGAIVACLRTHYDLDVASVRFLPLGFDLHAFVYEVVSDRGDSWFLKVRDSPVHEPGLLVSRALRDLGVPNILAPLPTRSAELWCPLDGYDGYTVVLFPFVRGENAKVAGMSDDQWREFGATIRAVHASGLEKHFEDLVRAETFALPSAALVRRMLALVESGNDFESAAANRFAAFWRAHAGRIERLLARAEELGRSLQPKPFALVLCHGDIHGANILVADDGRIWLVDWDGPLLAPRERDLLFVVGSIIGRPVEPRQEDRFFAGYGPTEIDPIALIYYRYERNLEDLGEIGKSVFLDAEVGEEVRAAEAELAMGMFAPGAGFDRAESVPRCCWG